MQHRRARRAISRGRTPSVIPYLGYGTTAWVRILGRVLYLKPSARSASREPADLERVSRVRGWRTFTSVSVPHQQIIVRIDDERIGEVVADRGGVIDVTLPAELSPGWHVVSLQAGEGDLAAARVFVVDPQTQIGVISDVDDTVLVTALPRPLVAAWNSFVVHESARAATPGMAVLLDHLSRQYDSPPVIYLSTGAWNVAPALTRFLARNLYPIGPLLLTDWGPTHDRWFRSGREHKRRELERLANEFPNIQWILIGDDGQHDEAIYHEFAIAHPENVAAVAIRQLSVGQAVLAGGRSKARNHRSTSGVPWVYGPDGATLQRELRNLGLLDA